MTAAFPLAVCTFKGLQNLPIVAARQQGFFAARGLNVEILYTSGSIHQLVMLVQGKCQLVQTAPDNVINSNGNPLAFGLDPTVMPSIRLLMGGSTGPLSLYAQPAMQRFADLRGAVLGVDNPGSGFALVLRDMLARNGLELDRDYRFVVAGGTSARLEALRDGAVAATLLYLPFDLMAASQHFHRLAISVDYYPAYASLATAGTRDWVEGHAESVIGYIVALRQALRWIGDPANGGEVQRLIVEELAAEMDASLAARAYEAFIDPVIGYGGSGRLDEMGLQQVIDLRARYLLQGDRLGTAKEYQDLRWYEEASLKMDLPK